MAIAPAIERPVNPQAAAALLASVGSARPVGGATKQDWGGVGPPPEVEICTGAMDAIIEHNEGDLTAVLGAGATLAGVQSAFAHAGQRLCLDPPDRNGAATIGGIVASADSGPLRHRYGAVRDLILGVRVALPDGTVARAGSNVIKNVAGYDLAKLMCGALGTLGVVCEVTLRLHPLPEHRATAVGRSQDPEVLVRAARTLAGRPLELDALDLRWDGPDEGGAVLARTAGHTAAEVATSVGALMREAGLEAATADHDDALWAAQRDRQRAWRDGAVVRVSTLANRLGAVLSCSSSVVARAGMGLAWVQIDADPEALGDLRARLAPAACVLLDAPERLRSEVDPWGVLDGPELTLARRVKERFDPAGVCNRGRYVGGL